MAAHLSLYWHTLRYLRPIQIGGRLWRRLHRVRPRDVSAITLRPGFPVFAHEAFAEQSFYPPSTFRFLGETENLSEGEWDDPRHSLLWRYNLHYFDDLQAQGATSREQEHAALMQRWIKENPPAAGTGWAPYPTSLRIVNWIKWLSRRGAVDRNVAHSLAQQADALSQQIETHLLGNHLFENARALVFAGCYFEGRQANAWLQRGLSILDQEIAEQFLADGGHFERSPMYQGIMLWGMLDLVELAMAGIQPELGVRLSQWRECVSRGGAWLEAMTHPDGEIAFFNDAAFGVAPNLAQLYKRAASLGLHGEVARSPEGLGLRHLDPSGYVSVATADARLIVDVAPIGPDYLPGHAHADTLSFELSLCGERVFVNSGTSCYGQGSERQRQRGTAAHNTVWVDGQDSSEVWGGFRVARRARPFGLRIKSSDAEVMIECAHDGYRRLPGGVIHRRRWTLSAIGLQIEDVLEGDFAQASAALHLHPDVAVTALTGGTASLGLANGKQLKLRVEGGELSAEPSSWHPRFGQAIETLCLRTRWHGKRLVTTMQWVDQENA